MKRFCAAMLAMYLIGFLPEYPMAEQKEPLFTIGVSIPLSGPFASFGNSVRRGIEMAKEDREEAFASMAFRFEDDRYDPTQTVRNFQRLRTTGRLDLMFIAGVGPTEAVAPLSDAVGVPLVVNCQRPQAALFRTHVIRFVNPTIDYVRTLIPELQRRGIDKISILATEMPYIEGYVEAFRSFVPKAIESIEWVTPFDVDFRSLIPRLREKSSGALGVFLIPGQLQGR